MSDDTNPGAPKGAQEGDSLVPEAEDVIGQGTGGAPQEETAPGLAGEAASDADELQRELEETKQHLLRALADAENVRRRAQKDVADARQYAITKFARDMLEVSDNFRRALATAEDYNAENLPAELQALIDGVRMTERELNAAFERHGITMEDPTGQRFDPNRHQAMYEVEDPTVPTGTVVQVVQTGSMIGERVLRPAMVAVSKGGPKPARPEATETGEAAEPGGEDGAGADEAAAGRGAE